MPPNLTAAPIAANSTVQQSQSIPGSRQGMRPMFARRMNSNISSPAPTDPETDINFTPAVPAPEPGSLSLLGSALAALDRRFLSGAKHHGDKVDLVVRLKSQQAQKK